MGALSFVSFVRRGLATALSVEEFTLAGPETVANLSVTLNTTGGATLEASPVSLSLVGPGDIVGLDPNVIVRLWPKRDDFDAEYIPYVLVEFDQADLPWRYSPAKAAGSVASGTDQLRPWLALVVVPASESQLDDATPSQKLAVLNVSPSSLPPNEELWAFAHTQFEGENLGEQAIKDRVQGAPGNFTARLMSARLLQPNTEYVACLVPTFERGRRVGLGLDLPDTLDALQGWDTSAPDFKLPVYYFWRFATGSAGSFEQLARLVKPAIVPETVGRRDMDVTDSGFNLPAAAPSGVPPNSLPVEGALMSVAAFNKPPTWPTADRQAFVDALEPVVNAPANASEPILVPPLYGQWYAAADELAEPTPAGPNPVWFQQLNSDPRNRVGAALGTTVIQHEQQALLASGWDQVADLPLVNDKLRVLQLGRGLLVSVYTRHFLTASLQRFYHLTRRLHARVVCGTRTVCENVDASPIVPGFLSAQWLRWTRARGPVGRFQGRPALVGFVPNLIDQLNSCRRPAPEPRSPGGGHDPGGGPTGGISCELIDPLGALGSDVLVRWALVILWVVRRLSVSQNGDCWWIALRAFRFAIGLLQIATSGGDVHRRCKWVDGALEPGDVLSAPFMRDLVGHLVLPNPIPLPSLPGGTIDSADAAAIRSGLAELLSALKAPPPLECPPPMDLERCRLTLVEKLTPELTVGQRLLNRLSINTSVSWAPVDPLEPMFAPPEYERPMYEPLSRVSYDWILPGLSQIKPNSTGLVVTNQRFVEAYMVGLNHEMTRELLWNEFPTDQRGTYFRQFWDIAGHILEDGSTLPPEQLRDILPVKQWSPTSVLGGNSPRPSPPAAPTAPSLVLVVRAQLIQKYPNLIVYAQKRDPATGTLVGEQQHPVFYALLKPDTAFYGFMLTEQDIRDEPDWYFVLQEQPGDPKFAEEGADLSTQIFSAPAEFFIRDDVTNAPVQRSSTSSSSFASETFLEPFRLGIQGTSMLPPET